MATAKFIQDGDSIDYTPPAASFAAGDVVVQGNLVGVAKRDIPIGTLGALAVTGVFLIPKFTGVAFSVGDSVYWDTAAKNADNTMGPGLVLMGKAIASAAGEDPTVKVRLSM
ncbi:MAG: DUF2190 family protein [Phycisphaerales bacterium]|nr:DUF2190 family protein [Phycisphaerales bacterium]